MLIVADGPAVNPVASSIVIAQDPDDEASMFMFAFRLPEVTVPPTLLRNAESSINEVQVSEVTVKPVEP
jgi:hypothetical protein